MSLSALKLRKYFENYNYIILFTTIVIIIIIAFNEIKMFIILLVENCGKSGFGLDPKKCLIPLQFLTIHKHLSKVH